MSAKAWDRRRANKRAHLELLRAIKTVQNDPDHPIVFHSAGLFVISVNHYEFLMARSEELKGWISALAA